MVAREVCLQIDNERVGLITGKNDPADASIKLSNNDKLKNC